MMEYYSLLVQYEGHIKSSFTHNPEKLKGLIEKLISINSVNDEEQMVWEDLNTAMPYSEEQVTELENQLTAFISNYTQKIEE
jgi:hypothetical protein